MAFAAHVHFQGNCGDAMALHAKVFGSALERRGAFDMPDGPPDAIERNQVLRAMRTTPGTRLSVSAFPPGQVCDLQKAVTLGHDAPDLVQAKAVYDTLLKGRAAIIPFAPAFWSAVFGMLKDRFGTDWMISVLNPV